MSLLKNTFTQTVSAGAVNTKVPTGPVPGASRLLAVYANSANATSGAAINATADTVFTVYKKDATTSVGTVTVTSGASTGSLVPTSGLAAAKTAIDTSFKDVQGATVAVQTIKDNTGTENLKVGRDGWYDSTAGGKDMGVNYLGATFPADSVLLDVASGDYVVIGSPAALNSAVVTFTLLWEKI